MFSLTYRSRFYYHESKLLSSVFGTSIQPAALYPRGWVSRGSARQHKVRKALVRSIARWGFTSLVISARTYLYVTAVYPELLRGGYCTRDVFMSFPLPRDKAHTHGHRLKTVTTRGHLPRQHPVNLKLGLTALSGVWHVPLSHEGVDHKHLMFCPRVTAVAAEGRLLTSRYIMWVNNYHWYSLELG